MLYPKIELQSFSRSAEPVIRNERYVQQSLRSLLRTLGRSRPAGEKVPSWRFETPWRTAGELQVSASFWKMRLSAPHTSSSYRVLR